MSTEVSTDVTHLVNSAFEEMECIWDTHDCEHGGDKAAVLDYHGCLDGFVCREHYNVFLRRLGEVPADVRGKCDGCGVFFGSVEEFVKVYPL
jgi:hypothetical protein